MPRRCCCCCCCCCLMNMDISAFKTNLMANTKPMNTVNGTAPLTFFWYVRVASNTKQNCLALSASWQLSPISKLTSSILLAPSYPNSENVHILWIHRTPDLSLWTHCFPNLFPCVWHVSHLWIDWLRWEDLSAQFGNCLAPCRCLVLFLKCYGAWMS